MANHVIALSFTTLIAVSSAYPLAALSALLGGNDLSANFDSNLNNIDGNLNVQQPDQAAQQQRFIPREKLCPCSNPQTEIFVTETPRGSEIIAAETTNENGLSLATINDEYVKPDQETNQGSGIDRNIQWSTFPPRTPISSLTTDQTIPVYPSRSYSGSLSGALSSVGHLGHSMSASGSLAGNLGYSSSMSGSSAGHGNGLGHVGSMAGSLSGPHGSMAGSLSGSHGIHGGSMASSLASSHHGGTMAGSLAGSHRIGGGSMSGSMAASNLKNAENNGDRVAGNRDESSSSRGLFTKEIGDQRRNDRSNDRRISAGNSFASNPGGTITGGENLQSHGAVAGSVAGASHQNGGSALAGSMASSSGNGNAQAGSIAGAQGNGSQGSGGGSAMSGSLAGTHNGVARALSTAMAGYHQQHDTLSQERKTGESQQPGEDSRRHSNRNENVNQNMNYNGNSRG